MSENWRILQVGLGLENIDGVSDATALKLLGLLIDHSGDRGDLAINDKAFGWIKDLSARSLSNEHQVVFDYFHANAWNNRQQAKQDDRKAVWAWDQEEIQQQILLLRRAARNPAFEQQHWFMRCQILTNLANQFDTIGRMVEARYFWSKALSLEPQFWMARGNQGRALMGYGARLYIGDHKSVFALQAHRDLRQALSDLEGRPELGSTALRSYFAAHASDITEYWNLEQIAKDIRLDEGDLGGSESEIAYRRWCLREGLFLNPLNDISNEPGASEDSLSLPSMIINLGKAPVLTGLFNQLKQEFVSARWSYYAGLIADEPHYSDFRVDLHDTLDYPVYGLAIEQIKMAFRISYSLFDKIAYFLDQYLSLGIKEKDISFRSIWRLKAGQQVRSEFDASENWPLRGLYWLSKDLFEKGFTELTEPDARDLHGLRNHLEHKYLKVHRGRAPARPQDPNDPANSFFDDFAHSISLADLESRTLRLIKLARAALIYLALGVHHEESRRHKDIDPDKIVSVGPFLIDDAFKTRL